MLNIKIISVNFNKMRLLVNLHWLYKKFLKKKLIKNRKNPLKKTLKLKMIYQLFKK